MFTGKVGYLQLPKSGVKIPRWDPTVSTTKIFETNDVAADRAFQCLYQGVQQSAVAKAEGIRVELAKYQPLGGDAEIQQEGLTTTERVELKQGVAQHLMLEDEPGEVREVLRILVGARDPGKDRRRSLFNPNRGDHFACLFDANYTSGYWIPARIFLAEYWSDAPHVDLPYASVRAFRFDINPGEDWYSQVHRRIVEPNRQSQRPAFVIPTKTTVESYAAAGSEKIQDSTADKRKGAGGKLTGYPYWKIERWNRDSAHLGRGVFLPLGRQESIANVAWVDMIWSKEEKAEYFSFRKLPRALHIGSISRRTPVFLFTVLCVRSWAGVSSDEFPSWVAGQRLDRGPFPRLYYVDAESWPMRKYERSGPLFPEELIDYDDLNERYSKACGESVHSCREMMEAVGKKRGIDLAASETDLSKSLRLPVSELMVCEGRDFLKAVHSFADAHARDEKPLTWFNAAEVSATGNYMVMFGDLLQALADKYAYELFGLRWPGDDTVRDESEDSSDGDHDDDDDESGDDAGDDSDSVDSQGEKWRTLDMSRASNTKPRLRQRGAAQLDGPADLHADEDVAMGDAEDVDGANDEMDDADVVTDGEDDGTLRLFPGDEFQPWYMEWYRDRFGETAFRERYSFVDLDGTMEDEEEE